MPFGRLDSYNSQPRWTKRGGSYQLWEKWKPPEGQSTIGLKLSLHIVFKAKRGLNNPSSLRQLAWCFSHGSMTLANSAQRSTSSKLSSTKLTRQSKQYQHSRKHPGRDVHDTKIALGGKLSKVLVSFHTLKCKLGEKRILVTYPWTLKYKCSPCGLPNNLASYCEGLASYCISTICSFTKSFQGRK